MADGLDISVMFHAFKRHFLEIVCAIQHFCIVDQLFSSFIHQPLIDVVYDECLQVQFDERAQSMGLGPTPVTDANLFASQHTYLPCMHTVLTDIENQVVRIMEPTPRIFIQ
jgi:hypothetical protein